MNENNNKSLIDGLRQAADWLEAHPDFPSMAESLGLPLRLYLSDKAELLAVAQQLGSFTKHFGENYFELRKPFGDALQIEVMIDRERVCKKIVTWECPDDESLLKLVETESSGA